MPRHPRDFERNDPSWGRPGGTGQSSGGAYPNRAGAGRFEGGQSGQGYYGPGRMGEGRAPNAASERRDPVPGRAQPRDDGMRHRDDYAPPRGDGRGGYAGYRGDERPDREYRGEPGRNDTRGIIGRVGDEVRAWFGDDEGERRRHGGAGGDDRAQYRAWGADVSGGQDGERRGGDERGRGDPGPGYRMQGYGYRQDRHRDD